MNHPYGGQAPLGGPSPQQLPPQQQDGAKGSDDRMMMPGDMSNGGGGLVMAEPMRGGGSDSGRAQAKDADDDPARIKVRCCLSLPGCQVSLLNEFADLLR
jgi:hypothetical protein